MRGFRILGFWILKTKEKRGVAVRFGDGERDEAIWGRERKREGGKKIGRKGKRKRKE